MTETPNLGLSQWSLDDLIKMADFNSDNLKIDNFGRLNSGLGNEYVWEKTKDDWSVNFAPLTKMYIVASGSSSSTMNISYSDSYEVSSDGTLSLVDAQSVAVSYNNYATTTEALKGKYIKGFFNDATRICYVPQDSQITAEYSSLYYVYATLRECSSFYGAVNYGYVNSLDPNAYPVSDGYTYTALGRLGDAFEAPKIATGTYTGTGKYGSSNLTTISLPFEPKAIIVNASQIIPLCVPQLTTSYVSYSTYILNGVDFTNGSAKVRKNGKQVQIYSDSGTTPAATWYPQFQLNTSGKTYYYLAIG